MRMSLRNLPTVIDPSVQIIEVQALTNHRDGEEFHDRTRGSWKVLHRVPTLWAMNLNVVVPHARHFFGNEEKPEDCSVIAYYDTGGCLLGLFILDDKGNIHVEELPDEVVGKTTLKPSVRLVFEDAQQRDAFIESLPHSVLNSLVEPPRRIGVGTK